LPNKSEATAAIIARRVSKCFWLRHNPIASIKERVLGVFEPHKREQREPFWALRDVSLTVNRGEAVGLVGRNGSGKSTFLKLVAGILTQTEGDLFVQSGARIGAMIELGVGFHPELTAMENIYLNAAIHGLSRDEITSLIPAIVNYSGLANFMDVPLKSFSSGMYMRLGFAVAANLTPDVLLIDEVFAVGDADFQRRCVRTMFSARERGCTILFVSHATAAVREVCSRVVAFDAGALRFDGDVDEGLTYYAKLMAADLAMLPGAQSRGAPTDDPTIRPHRLAMRTNWEALGPWAIDFLRRQGLTADQFFLDVGCGSLPVALHVLPFMQPTRYWGIDIDRMLFDEGILNELVPAGVPADRGHFLIDNRMDLSGCPYRFDMALAHSVSRRLTAEQMAHAVVSVVGHLSPSGRLYVAIPDDAPRHLAAVQRAAESLLCTCERVQDAAHPAGEPVYRIDRTVTSQGRGSNVRE
jgi:ABC-type polysaccharide/polyol phosphate transport system ATPase subunit/SAM-dependent methyltransferase